MPQLNTEQAEKAGEGQEFELLEPGTYLATLNAVNGKEGPKGDYWEWEFLLVGTEDGEELDPKPKLWENTSLSEKSIWRVGQMLDAFEVPHDTNTDDLLGLHVMINVGQEVIDRGSRQGQLRNNFLSAFPVPE